MTFKVGNDSFGIAYKQSLQSHGINVDNVLITEDISSGMAQITVSEAGCLKVLSSIAFYK